MSKFATRLVTVAIFATALSVNPLITAAQATSVSKHVKKHKRVAQHTAGYNVSWSGGRASPVLPSGEVCPGLGRSFDCKIWPPPFADDPDRRNSGRF